MFVCGTDHWMTATWLVLLCVCLACAPCLVCANSSLDANARRLLQEAVDDTASTATVIAVQAGNASCTIMGSAYQPS